MLPLLSSVELFEMDRTVVDLESWELVLDLFPLDLRFRLLFILIVLDCGWTGGLTGGDMALIAFSGDAGTGADLVRLIVGGRGCGFLFAVSETGPAEFFGSASFVFFTPPEENER